MKKFLLISLAALGFAACNQSDDIDSPAHNGEVEESYIAINLMSADKNSTRAATDSYGYEQGTDAERAINSAYFFFFDKDGKPFNVTATTNNPATAPGVIQGKNHLSLQLTTNTENQSVNISEITNAVLILNTYKGVYPSKIVAVLNWTPEENQSYSLEALHSALATIGNDNNGYVMSNSVYMDAAGMIVDAVPLTAANIKTTPEAAMAAPVDIYVERTAAKVVLTASKGTKVGDYVIFDTQKNSTPVPSTGTSSEIDVYVKLHGWELYNDYATSYLLKNIENWDIATLGLTWNDIPYYRCYWAQSQATTLNDEFAWKYTKDGESVNTYGGFPTEYGFSVAESANYAPGTYTYCGENTNGEAKRTKVILKGQLMQKNGDNYESLELARWYGTEYAGNEALRTAVANSLKYILYSSEDGLSFTSIKPEDLECVAGTPGAEAYEVGFQLSSTGEVKKWYKYSSQTGYVAMADIAVPTAMKTATNAHLATVEPALVYTNGQTYYYVDIEHLGTAGAKYGVVRNHVYQIDINSIKGYGSPVYIGTSNILTPPDYPLEDESSYVAARINVLSWKVVKQGVDITP